MDKHRLIQRLRCAEKDIPSLLAYSIGNFAVITKDRNELRIYCSIASGGVFYTEKDDRLYLSFYEEDIYQIADTLTLNSVWLLNVFYLGSFSSISGKTFFQEVRRIPAGFCLAIKRGGNLRLENYIIEQYKTLPDRSFNQSIHQQQFSKALEKVTKLIANASDDPIYLLFSGGIDSTCMFLALLNAGCKFTAVNITDFTPLIGIIKSFERIFGNNRNVKFLHLKVYRPSNNTEDLEFITESARHFFGTTVVSHPIASLLKYLKEHKILNARVLHGDGFDAMYTLRMTGSSVNVGLRPYHAYVKHFFKRFYLSDFYLRLVCSGNNGYLLKILRSEFFGPDPIDYATAMVAVPDSFDVPPYLYKIPNRGNYSVDDFKRLFIEPRREEVIRPIFDLKHADNYSDPSYLNYLVRLAALLSHGSGGMGNPPFHDARHTVDWKFIPIVFEPPIASLFVKLRIGSIYDMIMIKRGLFNYVNKNLKQFGTSYQKLARHAERSPEFNIWSWRIQESIFWRYIYRLKRMQDLVILTVYASLTRVKGQSKESENKPAGSSVSYFRNQYYAFLTLLEPSPLKDFLLKHRHSFENRSTSNGNVFKIACTIYYLSQFMNKLKVR
jgi:hypothetical protein